jgi:hypothetical protein
LPFSAFSTEDSNNFLLYPSATTKMEHQNQEIKSIKKPRHKRNDSVSSMKKHSSHTEEILLKPLRRKKSVSNSASKVIQDALNVVAAGSNDFKEETFFGDTSFFDQAFPATESQPAKSKSRKNKKEEPINFFESLDAFPEENIPKVTSKESNATQAAESREVSSSPKDRIRKSKTGEEQPKAASLKESSRDRSQSRHRSRSKHCGAITQRLDKTDHSKSTNEESSGTRSRSKSRGRSSSRHRSKTRGASTSREGRTRSKTSERCSETVENGRQVRRMLKQSSTSTPTTSSRSNSLSRSKHRSSSKERRKSMSTRTAIQQTMHLVFAEAEDTAHTRNLPPPPTEATALSSPSNHSRSALARRRAERTANKIIGDQPPTPPVRSPEMISPPSGSRKTRSSSVTRRRALSKRNLMDANSSHNTGSSEKKKGASPRVSQQAPAVPQPRRQLSLPVAMPRTATIRQVSFSGGNNTTSTPVTVSAITGDVAINTPSRRRPNLTRSSDSSGSGRHADARLDGLLQKLRDPSSRNVLSTSSKMQINAFGEGSPVEIQKMGGMISRFSKKSSLAGIRLDE